MTDGRLKRILLLTYDFVFILAIAIVLAFAFVKPAYAYVDPSVMTYAIQAFAGVAVALSTVLGVVFRRTRKKLFKLLRIDENSNKVVEPYVSIISPDDEEAHARAVRNAEQQSRLLAEGIPVRSLSAKSRLIRSFLVCFFVFFTLLFVAPYELVAGNSTDLLFGVGEVAPVMAVFVLVVSFLTSVIVSFLRGKAFDVALALVASVGLCFWLEALFLNVGLPGANGSAVDWSDYTTISILSCAVWVGVVLSAFFLSTKKRAVSRIAATFVSVALIFVQGIGLISASIPDAEATSPSYRVSQSGLLDVSSKKNVIVFCLDAMDTVELEQILQDYPDLFSDYTGFTYFKNVVGSGMPTHYGVPFLLSGEYPQYDESWTNYNEERWSRSTLLSDIHDAGYSIGLYSDTFANGLEAVSEYADNITEGGKRTSGSPDLFGTVKALTKAALYRDMPWSLKAPFWYYTDELNEAMKGSSDHLDREAFEEEPYLLKDALLYSNLKEFGLKAEDDGATGAFRFIHMFGSHEPFNMNELAQDTTGGPVTPGTADTSTSSQQTRGSLLIVAEYLNQLKSLGLYDDATIVITSDHGRHHVQYDQLDYAMCTTLLVKPSQTHDEALQPCKVSTAPTGHMDYAALLETAIGNNDSKYGTTTPFSLKEDVVRDRYFYMTAWSAVTDWGIREYKISGNALDFSNWSLTGVYWDCENYWRSSSDMGKTLADIDFDMSGAVGPVVQAGPGSGITSGNPDCLKDLA